ncbi:MAG: peptidylprolyl isomerase [archaeon]
MKKIFSLIVALIVLAALFGCTGSKTNDANLANDSNISVNASDINSNVVNNLADFKKVNNGDKVSVDYTGRLEDGSIFDSSVGKNPLSFTVGAGQMIKGFDAGVVGMQVGQKKTVTILAAEAYGEKNPDLVKIFDSNNFSDFNSLAVGVSVMAGNGMSGVVTSKTDKNATIDFNHELAGKTLIFDITLVSIN